jgi:predicted lactoylglutathione lyase
MSRKVFINLAVKDLPATVDFWKQLGFEFNPQFTDDNAACLVFSDDGYAMLLTEAMFKNFTKKPIVDSSTQTEAIICLSADSKEEVDTLVRTAIASGGSPAGDPIEQGDFMYGSSFQDPDGHHWEVLWMDPSAIAG